MVYACKKSNQPQPTTQTNTQTSVTQDSHLLGTWIGDSSKADGMTTSIYGSTVKDSIVISSMFYRKLQEYLQSSWHSNEFNQFWKTTSSDSLFTGAGSAYLDNLTTAQHYKYSFTGNILLLYENKYNNGGTAVKFWYHKKL